MPKEKASDEILGAEEFGPGIEKARILTSGWLLAPMQSIPNQTLGLGIFTESR
jgi:hypothetical protein